MKLAREGEQRKSLQRKNQSIMPSHDVPPSYEEAINSPPITLMLHHHYLPSHSSAPPFTLTRPGETTFTIPQQNYHTIAPQSPQPLQQTYLSYLTLFVISLCRIVQSHTAPTE
ncbi:hypothetical protein GWK47_033081 [Chionoecetes opilio]|uniref:Uncharacterized protein n=1 Tax=Chionoecetes opilio TaxID=41210 RepID=A0A8J5D455_CHIOP|nr:hypothetical protein GWK47_033081 [Chionoecetes opilio]